MNKFTIIITTKDRKKELLFTLDKIKKIMARPDVAIIICDDGSSDGTFEYLKLHFPEIKVIQNLRGKGLIYSRNRLMNLVKSEFAISIDDDLHFLSEAPLEKIECFFENNPKVALLGFRIFWGLNEPENLYTKETPIRVKSFAGGAHVWRMKAWKDVPEYPSWFVFYGEEDFQSYNLFKKDWQIFYLPEVAVNHRVDLESRTKNKDFVLRQRRSLRSGWYLFFLFYPLKIIPKKMAYSIWIQIRNKVIIKKDFKALLPIFLATFDLLRSVYKLYQHSNRLSSEEFISYSQLSDTRIYWQPEK